MTFCLDSTIIKPQDDKEIKYAIILLHGYGGDGKDISMLSLNWKRYLPNTIFICPNGHEPCQINPSGFQWFDLTKDDTDYILEQSIKAEEVLKKYNCKPTELPLIFVNDPAIMGLGVKPGDLIKITRPSPTAGESLYYRYVVEV